MKQLTLSIVIPVYNEEDHLAACLKSIAAQSVKPNQVIVVDNNSTDASVKIASKFSFVTLLHEKRQHQTFAQAKGFDAATSDIFARIDADTVLPKDWVARVLQEFDDRSVAAVTGVADPYDVPLKRIAVAVFEFYHQRVTHFFSGITMLWNSNAAFRGKYWPSVHKEMYMAANVWEDYEMSFWLAKKGYIKFMPDLAVGCSFRAVHKGFFTQLAYQFRAIRVFSRHISRSKTVLFFFAWYTMIPIFLLAMIDNAVLKLRRVNVRH